MTEAEIRKLLERDPRVVRLVYHDDHNVNALVSSVVECFCVSPWVNPQHQTVEGIREVVAEMFGALAAKHMHVSVH